MNKKIFIKLQNFKILFQVTVLINIKHWIFMLLVSFVLIYF